MDENCLKELKKQTLFVKLTFGLVAGIFAIFLVVAIIVVPKVTKILNDVEETVASADEAVKSLSKTADELAEADIAGLINNTQALVEDSSKGVTQAISKIDDIDIDGLNVAISDLESVVGPLANLFGGGSKSSSSSKTSNSKTSSSKK